MDNFALKIKIKHILFFCVDKLARNYVVTSMWNINFCYHEKRNR